MFMSYLLSYFYLENFVKSLPRIILGVKTCAYYLLVPLLFLLPSVARKGLVDSNAGVFSLLVSVIRIEI